MMPISSATPSKRVTFAPGPSPERRLRRHSCDAILMGRMPSRPLPPPPSPPSSLFLTDDLLKAEHTALHAQAGFQKQLDAVRAATRWGAEAALSPGGAPLRQRRRSADAILQHTAASLRPVPPPSTAAIPSGPRATRMLHKSDAFPHSMPSPSRPTPPKCSLEHSAISSVNKVIKLHAAWRSAGGTSANVTTLTEPVSCKPFAEVLGAEFPRATGAELKAMLGFVEIREGARAPRQCVLPEIRDATSATGTRAGLALGAAEYPWSRSTSSGPRASPYRSAVHSPQAYPPHAHMVVV
jgi:hypothetical protein